MQSPKYRTIRPPAPFSRDAPKRYPAGSSKSPAASEWEAAGLYQVIKCSTRSVGNGTHQQWYSIGKVR